MLLALDVETECAEPTCDSPGSCKHALDQHRSNITVVAVSNGDGFDRVFRGPNLIEELQLFIDRTPATYTFHNGKFDIKQLVAHGLKFNLDLWEHDSSILAFNSLNKIPESWLIQYEDQRRLANAKRTGTKHRVAGPYSLKTLAPYFLSVPAFWEPETGHDDDEYVLKDTRYTALLTKYFLHSLQDHPKILTFYKEKHLEWTKTLLRAELKGIRINLDALDELHESTEQQQYRALAAVHDNWSEHFAAWEALEKEAIDLKYNIMRDNAQAKGRWSDKIEAQHVRNRGRAKDKVEPLNIDSPKQLTWLFLDRLNYDITNLDGEESTDKESLNRLAQKHSDVRPLLEYRKTKKLCTTYFPEYKAMQTNSRIYTSFNSIGTRTGRLSSSGPNLQQCPAALHSLFEADEGTVFVTRDLSAIEPTVLAYYSEDAQLCDLMIHNKSFHDVNVAAMFEPDCPLDMIKKLFPTERKVAKECGLAVLYGAGANRIHQVLQKHGLHEYTLGDARRFVYKLREIYSDVWAFKTQLDKELEAGNLIFNLLGRPLQFTTPETVYMQGLNTLIQSTASDMLQQAGYRIEHELGYQPLLWVHDEIVVQVPEERAEQANKEITEIMSDFKLNTIHGNIPVRSEGAISKTWEK